MDECVNEEIWLLLNIFEFAMPLQCNTIILVDFCNMYSNVYLDRE